MTAAPYDPRSAIDERDDVVLVFDAIAGLMGGGLHARRGPLGVIVIDPGLEGPDRRAVLTHELVHHERDVAVPGSGAPVGLALIRDREERAVDDEVARRLVPSEQLASFIDTSAQIGAGIGAAEVAEHFEVPLPVARRALERAARPAG